ncbi:MAG: sigma-54-dependent Fis family transcriptional regulator [Candidatus Rokubacteria bacterium]|nr:sigma-54-dependent Fis family transcriptional regulator [Candidatus Rokubacteria bacterium]
MGEERVSKSGERILVVDDEENMVHFLTKLLANEGYGVEGVRSGTEALERIKEMSYDLVLCDLRLPGADGIEVLKAVRETLPEAAVVVITAYGTIPSAIEAMRAGAYDYVTKPFRAHEILAVVDKALERIRLRREVQYLRRMVEQRFGFGGLVGKSKPMQEVYTQIEKVAAARGAVLIQGESGTGKELVAKAIHHASPRRSDPFVVIDCGAIPEPLQESELFGHVKGAFTGAIATKRGLFEEAHGGTLFLDEVAELAPSLQAKLLRALQDGEIRRVGDTRVIQVDVRVIAATNRDLDEEVRQGAFREDLYYRLTVFPIRLPPLRERREDIPLLVEHCLGRMAEEADGKPKRLSPDALRVLTSYSWPGNVRELEHVLERAALLSEEEVITERDLPPHLTAPQNELAVTLPEDALGLPGTTARIIREVERELIRRALARTANNRTEAARLLGISRRALLYKLKAHGLGRS